MVFYHASAIAEKDEVSCHGNAIRNSKPYFWTSKDVLQNAREKCVNGLNTETVYDELNKESGGVYYSSHKVVYYETHCKYTDKKKDKREQRNEHTRIVRRIINDNNAAAF